MISNILKKDHEDLLITYKVMKPEERLVAFLNHSRLMHKLYQAGLPDRQAGKPFRRSSRTPTHNNIS